jgi:hydroxymethylpyrimidine/phosphomethylpyrimidine kinase
MKSGFHEHPVAMTIAGSDSSAGAGIQADLKTFSHFHVHGLTAVTCIVAEVPGRVQSIQAIDIGVVRDQIKLGFETYPVRAVKTGLLYSAGIIAAVCDELERLPRASRPALVVDPVMIASSGDPLLQPLAVKGYEERLLPLASLVTPNLDEAGALTGRKLSSLADLKAAGSELTERFGVPFLIKGGHLRGETAVDVLFGPGGEPTEFTAPFVGRACTHGTGCTYSAAIAAQLALGQDLPSAIGEAKLFVTRAIRESLDWLQPQPVSALKQW